MYNKLFTKILDSSIWLESMATRITWVTLLAAMDEDGFCAFASPANLAHRAVISLEEAQEALRVLEAPDPNSSDPDHEGRRLERVPGGWIVLNAEKYRMMATRAVARERTKERVRRHRAKRRAECENNGGNFDSVTPDSVTCNADSVTGADGENASDVTESGTDVTESVADVTPGNAGVTQGSVTSAECNAAVTQSEADTDTDALFEREDARVHARARAREGASERPAPDGDPFGAEPAPRADTAPRAETERDRWAYGIATQPWVQVLKRASCKIGPQNWQAWQGLADLFAGDFDEMARFARTVSADQRWPDKVEAERRKQRPDAVAQADGAKVVHL